MSWEDDVVRRANLGSGEGPDRRGHFVKMGAAGVLMLVCFGLFACGILGGKAASGRAGASLDQAKNKTEAAQRIAVVSGPAVITLLLGSASGIYFAFLLLRLNRFD